MAWWQSALGIPQGDGGLLSDPRAMAGAQGLAGLTSTFGLLSAAFAPTTDPSQRGRILAGIGPAAQQAMRGARAGAMEDERGRQVQAWRSRVASLPEDQRALYGALPPEAGAPLLLQDQRRREAMETARNVAPGLFGAPPATMPAPGGAPAPAAPMGAPGGTQAPADLMPLFQRASAETGVPVQVLMAQARQESNFNPNATGRAGEIGIGQVMPSTAQNPGFGVQPVDPARLRDPAENIMFQARYLAGRARAAGLTDWSNQEQVAAALRAYNGGGDPNYVQNVTRFLPPGAGQVQTAGGGGQMQPPAAGGPPLTQQQYIALAQAAVANPELAPLVQAAGAIMRQENRPPVTLSPGQVAVDPVSGRQVASLPERPGETERLYGRYRELLNKAERTGPETAEMEALRGRLGAERTVDRGPSTFDAERGKEVAGVISGIEKAGRSAPNQVMRLSQIERDLERVTTGVGSGAAITAGQLAQRFGVPDSVLSSLGIGKDQVASAENIRSLSMSLVQATLASGEFPSQNFSNADMAALQQANPSLFNSPEGNRAIIAVQRAMAERNTEIARAWSAWRRENGSGMESAQRFLDERMPEVASRDVLAPILKDFAGAPAQPTGTARPEAPLETQLRGPGGVGTAEPPAPAAPVTRRLRVNPQTGRIE